MVRARRSSSPHTSGNRRMFTIRRIVVGVALAVVVAVVAGIAIAVAAVNNVSTALAEGAVPLENQVELPPEIGEFAGPFSVLIVGTDECEPELAVYFGERCTGAETEAQNNDLTMLVHVSDSPRRVSVISFPRDLMIPIPECVQADGSFSSAMSKQMLGSAHYYGGLSCVTKTVSELTGVDIPFAAQLSFSSVIAITDTIGGVEVCIGNEGIRDRHTGIDWPAGMRSVQGMDALQFLRTRHGVGDESDLARIGNQQQYLSRLLTKIQDDNVLTSPTAVYELAMATAKYLVPSESLASPLRLAQLALAIKGTARDDITFVQYPVTLDPQNPNRVVPDYAAASVLWEALATNSPLVLTGAAGGHGGVTLLPAPTPESADAGSTPTSSPEPTLPEGAVQLPSTISGSTATQETCASGNIR